MFFVSDPTVLDRLNPLLEPGGVLMVNERGLMKNGEIKIVRPHPNFRIFLAMDPRSGEISRAMRNRGSKELPSKEQKASSFVRSLLISASTLRH